MRDKQVSRYQPILLDNACGLEIGFYAADNRACLTISIAPDWAAVMPEMARLEALFGEPTIETIDDDGRLYYEWQVTEEGIKELTAS
jgi:hypothetical protein